MRKTYLTIVLLLISLQPLSGFASEREFRVGIIASLTGFAAPYGRAVVDGAETAVAELAKRNIKVRLFIEDDRSELKNAATAYQKLKGIDNIEALIGGSWWLSSVVKLVERDPIPFISCETLYNKDFIKGRNYFSLAGDLRNWIRAFRPLVDANNWHSTVMVRFVSGFADTLESELAVLFSPPRRRMFPSLLYSDLEMTGASSLAARALAMKPDAIFVDAQPETFAIFVRELDRLRAPAVAVLSHSVADDAIQQNLFETSSIDGRLFFLRRSSYSAKFLETYRSFKSEEPRLNADLGYYALHLSVEALNSSKDAVWALKQGLSVAGLSFTFDENNVSHTVIQEVHALRDGTVARFSASP